MLEKITIQSLLTSSFIRQAVALSVLFCLPVIGAAQPTLMFGTPSPTPSELRWGQDYTLSFIATSLAQPTQATTLTLHITEDGVSRRIDETPYGLANEFLPLQRQVSIPALGARTSHSVNVQGTTGIGLAGMVALRYCDDTQTLCTDAFNVNYLSDTPSRDINGNYWLFITTSTVVSGSCAAVREREQRVKISQTGNTSGYSFSDDFGLSAMLSAAISSSTYVFTRQYSTAPAFSGTSTLIVRTEFSDNDNGTGLTHWSYQTADGNLCRGTYQVSYRKLSEIVKVRVRVFLEGALSGSISNTVAGATLPERVQDTVLSKSGALYALRDNHTIQIIRPLGSRQQLVDTSFRVGEVDVHDLVFAESSDSTNQLYIVDGFLRAVIAVDLSDGSRSVISGCDIINRCPSGHYQVGEGVPLTQPADAVLDEAGNRLIISDTYLSALIAVDLTNGNRSVVSGCTANDLCPVEQRNIGDGTPMLHPHALSINSSATRLVVVDDQLDALLVVDATTGDRAIVSGCLVREICLIPERGSGPSFDKPIAVELDDDAGLAYVVDNGLEAVVEVDLDNGNRTNLLSPVTTRAPYHLILDEDTERVLVYNEADGSLTAIPQASRTPTQLTTYIRPGSSAPLPPSSPRDLVAEARDDVVALSWRPANRATSYKIYWNSFANMNGGQADQVIPNIYGTSYVHTGLSRGELYYYAVSAVNEQGESAVSQAVSVMLPLPTGNDETPPTPPVIVSAYASSTTAIALDWMASTDDRSAAEQIVYEVHIAESTATAITTDTRQLMVQGIYSANVGGLTTSQTYYVHVAALDEAGNRSLSEMVSIRTMSRMPKLSTQNEVVLIRIDTTLNADGTITIDRRDDLEVGQVVVMVGQDESYLRRITRIEILNSSQMLLHTEQASLADVFADLSLEMNVRLEDVDDDAAIAAAKSAQVRAEQQGQPTLPTDSKLRQFSPALRSPMSVPASEVWPYQPVIEGGEQVREMHWPDSGFRLRQSEPLSQTDDPPNSIRDGVGLRQEQQPSELHIPANYKLQRAGDITIHYPSYVALKERGVAAFDVYVEYPRNSSDRCAVSIEDITQKGVSQGRQGATVRAKPASAGARIVEHRVRWQTSKRHKSQHSWDLHLLFDDPCGQDITIPMSVSSDEVINLFISEKVNIPTPHSDHQFSGDIELDFDPELEISINQTSSKPKSLEVTVGGDIDLDILLELITAAGLNGLDREIEIGKKKNFYRLILVPTPLFGIPIPILVTGELSLKVKGEADVSAQMDVEQRFQSTYKLRAGFRYQNGRFVPVSSADGSSDYVITVKTAAGMVVKFSLIPQLDLGLYNASFTNIQLLPYVQGNGNLEGTFVRRISSSLEEAIDSSDYRFTRLDSGLGISANINVDLAVIGLSSLADTYELFDVRRALTSLPEMMLEQGGNNENTYTVLATPGQWFVGDNKIQEGRWSVVPLKDAPRLMVIDRNTVRVDDSQAIEEGKYKLRYTGHSRYGEVIQQYEEIPIAASQPLKIISPMEGAVFRLTKSDEVPETKQVQVVIKASNTEVPVSMTLRRSRGGASVVSVSTSPVNFALTGGVQRTARFMLTAKEEGNTTITIVATDSLENRDEVNIRVKVEPLVSVCDRTLQIRDEIIRQVGKDDCAEINAEDLAGITEMFLEGSNVSSLLEGDFNNLTNLQELALWESNVSTLSSGIFSGLTNLRSLNLGYNELSNLPSSIFSRLTNLQALYLGGNNISNLPSDIFSRLTNLQELNLHFNELSTFPSGIFSRLTNLQALDLGGNSISTLPSGIFSRLTNLQALDLAFNNISTLPSDIFSRLTNLQALNLSSNKFSTLPSGIFRGLTNLQDLVLHFNELSTLPSGIFRGLTNLQDLVLHSNKFSTLPSGIFHGLTNLRELSLSSNNISTLPSGIFRGLTNLQELRLGGNDLSDNYCTFLENRLSSTFVDCD